MTASEIIANFRDWDDVRITGTSTAGLYPNRRVEGLVGTIGCRAKDGSIKLWPHDNQGLSEQEVYEGKVWFMPETIERIELLQRDEE